KHADTTDLMVKINGIISEYISVEDIDSNSSEKFDISKINFDILAKEFAKAKHKNLILQDLEEVIKVKLEAMLSANPNRIDYYERYRKIIEGYNAEQDRATIEKTFEDLMNLVNEMTNEEQRYVREGLNSDDELAVYDLLFKNGLSKNDIKKIKTVAIELLQNVKEKISELDHWTDKQETKATVDNLIRDTLWDGLPESYDEFSISHCRQKIYEYMYIRYGNIA
ncbi:MAG: type I restriction endonuclease subunit R, partial [Oscillospiraceae bacterium]